MKLVKDLKYLPPSFTFFETAKQKGRIVFSIILVTIEVA